MDEVGNSVFADGEAIEFFRARAGFYRMLASLFWQPLTEEQIDAMSGQNFEAFSQIGDECARGANDMRRYLRRRHSGTRRELACDFTSVFGGTHSFEGRYATPYESLFTSEDGRFYASSYHAVLTAYKRERVRLEGKDYPEDHLSFMCEFMAIESDRIADSLGAGDVDGAMRCLKASRDFLSDHILSWYGRFAELAFSLVETRFYRGVIHIAQGWFECDAAQIRDVRRADVVAMAAA